MEEGPAPREPSLDVAPLISDAKAAQAWRRFLCTVLGGGRILPGMTLKIYLFQACVWLLPLLLGVTTVAFIRESSFVWLRLCVAAAANVLFSAGLEIFHACALRQKATGLKVAWFVDEEAVDFSVLFSPQVMDILLPRRSWLSTGWCCVWSGCLGGLAAQLLEPRDLAERLQLDSTSALVVCCWAFLTVGTAHFSLNVQPVPEVSCSSSESRPFTVIPLLFPLLFDLPVEVAQGLVVCLALLPLLWAIGLLASLPELLLWCLEQVELHFFGGCPPQGQVLWRAMLSAGSCTLMAWAGDALSSWELTHRSALLAIMSLSLSALLLTLTPSLRDLRVDFWWHLLVLWAQVLVAGGLSLGLCFVAWSDHDGLRIGMEQFAFLLTLLAVYVFGVRQLSVQCCGRRNAQYARRRSTMPWGDRGVPWEAPPRLAPPVSELLEDILAKGLAQTGTAVVDATSTCDRNRWMRRVARSVEVLEVVARILLWIHMAVLGTRSLLEQDTNFGLWVFLAALQLRQLRLSACDVPRAALDAALAGLLQYFRTTFAEWPLAVQIWVISVLCQRLALLWAYLRYVVHLCWITLEVPKLRHPLTSLLVWLNVLLLPALLVLVLLAVLLEVPLLAVFTLPLFTLSAPRPQESQAPITKGSEGLFYSIMAPSLLSSLSCHWRARTVSRSPGSLLFCRSHERLACVVRVLASGFGWVQLELRGLEMQEPTSCHHVEAGKIDEAFAHAFENQRPPERSFVLQPVCEAPVRTYEQSLVSLRGLLDNPQLLRQVHQLFLKSLVWIFVQLKKIPKGWLDCPLKREDANEVQCLLTDISWPPAVFQALHLPELLRVAAAAEASGPRPPSGSPPLIRPPQKAADILEPSPVEELPRMESEDGDDLDRLMDQVLGMAPKLAAVKSENPAKQAARKLLSGNDEGWVPAEGSQSLRVWEDPFERRLSSKSEKPEGRTEALRAEDQPHGETVGQEQSKSGKLAQLVIQAYVAVNVAPLFGQKPEDFGISHVLRLWGLEKLALWRSQETAELRWLAARPELLQLTTKAFRFAFKIAIDAAAMGEEVDMEYTNFEELAEDLHKSWFLGEEGSQPWEAAMKARWPNLMALRSPRPGAEVQVLRLRYSEEACRVGHLRPEVWNSIWAAASMELRYLANDDDERYSIQAHPTLFRNMAVQFAEYPIFVSPATTVWL